jgi:hypothetical protein
MSVKTCQLCGKPLSRLRVGADPEFCSKEHRSQFRLRKGMDRLVEVNKVANLMRRRESPRQITFSSLMCQSAITPRGFYDAERTAVHTTPFNREFNYQEFAQPRITAHADDCLAPRTRRHSGQKALRRPNTGKIRINNIDPRPMMPDGRWALPARIVQAPARNLHHRAPARPVQREFKLLRQSGIRVHVGKGPAALRRATFCGTEALGQGVRKPGVRFIAAVGNPLRVSIGKGFTIATAHVRKFESRPAMCSALVIPKSAMQVSMESLNSAAVARSLTAGTTAIALRIPRSPRAAQSSQFPAHAAMPPAMGSARAGAFPPVRSSAVAWQPCDAKWNPGGITPPSAGFARRNGAHLKRLAMMPNGVTSAPQVTFAPFVPQEPKGCPVVPFQAVIAGGAQAPAPTPAVTTPLADAPQLKVAPKPVPVAVHFEEHFDAGWDNWVGGVQDWKVDVAGVRTGAMALFMPTLDLEDYELEFLARIDAKSVNWVVRASGEDQHVHCTLTVLEGNQLEFSRTFVKGGATENKVVSSTRVPGKKRSAVTIRTVVSGSSFAVAVDGKTVDTWTENRLPSGGVGFTGAPDDRARLYWVKVSSSQNTGKE